MLSVEKMREIRKFLSGVFAIALALFHLLWPQAQWDRAVLIMFLLPPPYVLPIFSTDEEQRGFLSSVLSLSTLVTLAGFVLLAVIG